MILKFSGLDIWPFDYKFESFLIDSNTLTNAFVWLLRYLYMMAMTR